MNHIKLNTDGRLALMQAFVFCFAQILGRHFDDEAHSRVCVVFLVVSKHN